MLQDIFGLCCLSKDSSQWEGQRIIGIGNKVNGCYSHSEVKWQLEKEGPMLD